MNYPEDLKYTKEHQWIRVEGDVATIGITDFAQSELGDVVFVELPTEGMEVEQNNSFCVAESTKAASDVYAPVSGKIKEVNTLLSDDPSLLNTDPYQAGWIIKIVDFKVTDLDSLMDAAEYQSFTTSK
ncbi:MAG: glycine cleavage system protein GcvH [Bdellovibrionota bacterium]|jgi:glycine cleavage system H protein